MTQPQVTASDSVVEVQQPANPTIEVQQPANTVVVVDISARS